MKAKKLSLVVLSLLVSASSFSLATALQEEKGSSTVAVPSSFTFIDALERNYVSFDQKSFISYFGKGLKAQRSGNLQDALKAYLEAARYGDIRAFKGVGECYAGLGEWNKAFKWMVWALQEGYGREKPAYDKVLPEILKFLNDNKNQENLKGACKGARKNWPPHFNKTEWKEMETQIRLLEPYLTHKEIVLKEEVYKLRRSAESLEVLEANYGSLDLSKRELFLKKLESLNTIGGWQVLAAFYDKAGNLPEVYRCANTVCEMLGGRDILKKETFTSAEIIALVRLGSIYERFNPDDPAGAPAYSQALQIYEVLEKEYVSHPEKFSYINYAGIYNNLGVLYEQGRGCEKDEARAFELVSKSYAISPQPCSAYTLGAYYLNGTGVKVDYELGRKYSEEAAEKGEMSAYTNLGSIYLNGWGVKRSLKQALEYYRKAAQAGDEIAKRIMIECAMKKALRSDAFDEMRSMLAGREGDPNYFHLFGMLYFYGDSDQEYGLKLAEQALEYAKKAGIQRNGLKNVLMDLLAMYGSVKINAIVDEQQRLQRLNELEEEFEALYSPEEITEKLYYKALVSYWKKEYAPSLEYLNQAYMKGYDDPAQLFIRVSRKLSQQAAEAKDQEKALKKQQAAGRKAEKEEKKATKKVSKEAHKRQNIARRFLSGALLTDASKSEPRDLKLTFINDKVKEDYDKLLSTPSSKLTELMDDIRTGDAWKTQGAGKPEVLKGSYKGQKGAISRRLDGANRFVYKVTEPGTLLVLGCKGHYEE